MKESSGLMMMMMTSHTPETISAKAGLGISRDLMVRAVAVMKFCQTVIVMQFRVILDSELFCNFSGECIQTLEIKKIYRLCDVSLSNGQEQGMHLNRRMEANFPPVSFSNYAG